MAVSLEELQEISRAPRGARGLKLNVNFQGGIRPLSRPSRGAWIEINYGIGYDGRIGVAPLAGRVD